MTEQEAVMWLLNNPESPRPAEVQEVLDRIPKTPNRIEQAIAEAGKVSEKANQVPEGNRP